MKHICKIALLFVLVLTLLVCTGCNTVLDAVEDDTLRQNTEAMLDATAKGDFNAAYNLVSDVGSADAFREVYDYIRGVLDGSDSYELELVNINKNVRTENGVTVEEVRSIYKLIVNEKWYVLDVARHSSYKNFYAFHIAPYEDTNLYKTGDLGSLEGANPLQWIFLFSNLLSVPLIVYVIVDIVKSKIEKKWLWIAISVITFLTVSLTVGPSGFNVNFFIGFWQYTALVIYGGGTVVIRAMLPLGAFMYLLFRKSLKEAVAQKEELLEMEEYSTGEVERFDEKFDTTCDSPDETNRL